MVSLEWFGIGFPGELVKMQERQKCEQWKCIECLGISAEVYDALIENKEICWFSTSCNGEALRMEELEEEVL